MRGIQICMLFLIHLLWHVYVHQPAQVCCQILICEQKLLISAYSSTVLSLRTLNVCGMCMPGTPTSHKSRMIWGASFDDPGFIYVLAVVKQQTGSKLAKDYVKAVYCHLTYLLMCRVHHVKCQAGWVISWNRDRREKHQLRYVGDTTLMAESEEELKNLLMRVKEESERAALRLNIKKN